MGRQSWSSLYYLTTTQPLSLSLDYHHLFLSLEDEGKGVDWILTEIEIERKLVKTKAEQSRLSYFDRLALEFPINILDNFGVFSMYLFYAKYKLFVQIIKLYY